MNLFIRILKLINLHGFSKKVKYLYLCKIKYPFLKIGINPSISSRVSMWAKHQIVIGDNFYIGSGSLIHCDAIIGDDVIIAHRVAFVGKYDHNYLEPGKAIRNSSAIWQTDYRWKGLDSKVIIEDDVWIGYGAILMSGIRIKRGSIIAAGSVVTKDVDEFSIYAGNPAKKIKNRFDNEQDKMCHIQLYYK